MHTQHVKFSTYVAWGGVVRAVAVVVVSGKGEASVMGASDDVDGSVSEVVVAVVVVVFLSSVPSVPPLLLLRSIGNGVGARTRRLNNVIKLLKGHRCLVSSLLKSCWEEKNRRELTKHVRRLGFDTGLNHHRHGRRKCCRGSCA